jgi:hypothetical protein
MYQESSFVALYTGTWDDFKQVIEHHPQRGTKYSETFNNCQHFVGHFFLLLHAFARETPGRKFIVRNNDLYETILSGVFEGDATHLWHKSNLFLSVRNVIPHSAAIVATGGAAVAAEATVLTTATVPATGLAGWFGMTTTTSVLVPAAYASAAAVAVPIALGASVASFASYLYVSGQWRKRTKFVDPRIHGFPEKEKQMGVEMTRAERWISTTGGCVSTAMLFGSVSVSPIPAASASAPVSAVIYY